MKSLIKADDHGLILAAETLNAGGVVVIPTDTVYGLAARPDFSAAVERLYTIKQRAAKKPIALLAADAEDAKRFLGETAAEVGSRRWPGALTVVAHGEGVRVPDHDWTRRLLAACGGTLRVTSANMSGERPATDAEGALAEVGLSADLVVDDGVSRGGMASTVVEVLADGTLKILRAGPEKFLILASGSPRRAKILKAQGVDFAIMKTEIAEVAYPDDPERTVIENALAKQGDERLFASGSVLSADTIVWYSGRIFGKPRTLEEAKEFLRTLSGKSHTVYTGVAYNGETRVVKSEVRFRRLTSVMIDNYVRRVRPLDRAGAYDIDESGDLIVESYTGSYENIMGLPLAPLCDWQIIKDVDRK